VGFIEEFKRAYAGDETQHYSVAGKQVTCPHCGGEDFDRSRALLNTTGFTLLGLDWANREADLLICTTCSEIRWFLETPERM
jgi:hypothetical protein